MGKVLLLKRRHPIPDSLLRGVGAMELVFFASPLFVDPTWGNPSRGDVAWFTLARGAMAQAHALRQFESLYDSHHALKEDLETTRSHLVRSREDFTIVQNFYNTLSERNRKLREEHDQLIDSRRMRSFGPNLLLPKGRKVLMMLRSSFPLWWGVLIQSHDIMQSPLCSYSTMPPSGHGLRGTWYGEARSEEELRELMMRMNGFDAYSDKKMNVSTSGCSPRLNSHDVESFISHLSEKSRCKIRHKTSPGTISQGCSQGWLGVVLHLPQIVRGRVRWTVR
ncbi:hypothetical protein Tco_1464891 [Tanacetum coccineum]